MSYTLIKGSFHIHYPANPLSGPEPDGDTLKFQPDQRDSAFPPNQPDFPPSPHPLEGITPGDPFPTIPHSTRPAPPTSSERALP